MPQSFAIAFLKYPHLKCKEIWVNLIENGTKELVYKIETNSQISKIKLRVTKGEKVGGGILWEDGINIHILIYIK